MKDISLHLHLHLSNPTKRSTLVGTDLRAIIGTYVRPLALDLAQGQASSKNDASRRADVRRLVQTGIALPDLTPSLLPDCLGAPPHYRFLIWGSRSAPKVDDLPKLLRMDQPTAHSFLLISISTSQLSPPRSQSPWLLLPLTALAEC